MHPARFVKGRTGGVVLGSVVLLALGSVGASAAPDMITTRDIKYHTIIGVDMATDSVGSRAILNGSVRRADLHSSLKNGLKGKTGAKGETGPKGETGAPGAKGEPGAPGATGEPGAPGVPGVQGERGKAGHSAYEVYVASLSPSQTPLSQADWLASLKGERGPQGDPGQVGEQGEQGEHGDSAYEVYVASLSPSQTPLSQADWLASLKGERGPQGDPGAVGPAGPQGEPGAIDSSGYNVRTSSLTVSGSGVFGLSVACQPGELATGGGVQGSNDIIVHESYPYGLGAGWYARAARNTTAPTQITTYAVCLKVSNATGGP
ncbi:MAG TPA: hypothetical protein VER39_01890 [Nocardioidaceae bacterium]|nr:hypothetical protein [Nocardioidaceae bacterium]